MSYSGSLCLTWRKVLEDAMDLRLRSKGSSFQQGAGAAPFWRFCESLEGLFNFGFWRHVQGRG